MADLNNNLKMANNNDWAILKLYIFIKNFKWFVNFQFWYLIEECSSQDDNLVLLVGGYFF